jgi:hypothetical protein
MKNTTGTTTTMCTSLTRYLAALVVVASIGCEAPAAEPSPGVNAVAQQTFKQLREAKGPGQMGQASLDRAYQVFFVRLDRLAKYDDSKSATELLSGGTKWIFPIVAKAAPGGPVDVIDAIVVEGESPEKGRLVAVGDASVAAMQAATSQASKAAPGSGDGSIVYVQVPALNRAYIGRKTPSGLWLREIESAGEVPTVEKPAAEVFRDLSVLAKSVDPTVPN